jgi:hypothetical protein
LFFSTLYDRTVLMALWEVTAIAYFEAVSRFRARRALGFLVGLIHNLPMCTCTCHD